MNPRKDRNDSLMASASALAGGEKGSLETTGPANVVSGTHRKLNVVLSEETFAEWGNFSLRTAQRMRQYGTGPPFIRLTPGKRGRVGYYEDDLLAWLKTRRRTSTSDTGQAA